MTCPPEHDHIHGKLKALKSENARLKRIVAEKTSGIQALKGIANHPPCAPVS